MEGLQVTMGPNVKFKPNGKFTWPSPFFWAISKVVLSNFYWVIQSSPPVVHRRKGTFMSPLIALILFGILQGITEFLPVSSSGHLTLMQYFLEEIPESLSLNIAVHVGTLFSILVFYRKDLSALLWGCVRKEKAQWLSALWIVVATVPTAVLGLTVKKGFPWLLSSPWLVGVCLIFTGVVLFSSRWVRPQSNGGLTFQKALVLGIVQGFAVLPGLSRSGLTIVSALWLGVEKEAAARFSFLISVPAITGAALLEFLSSKETVELQSLVTASLVSFIVGLGAISLVVWLTRQQRLSMFSYYLWVIGLLVLGKLYLST